MTRKVRSGVEVIFSRQLEKGDKMKQITLGKTGLSVKRLGFGGIPIQKNIEWLDQGQN